MSTDKIISNIKYMNEVCSISVLNVQLVFFILNKPVVITTKHRMLMVSGGPLTSGKCQNR